MVSNNISFSRAHMLDLYKRPQCHCSQSVSEIGSGARLPARIIKRPSPEVDELQGPANPKGPKYLYGTKYGFCSSNFSMVWVSIPRMATSDPLGKELQQPAFFLPPTALHVLFISLLWLQMTSLRYLKKRGPINSTYRYVRGLKERSACMILSLLYAPAVGMQTLVAHRLARDYATILQCLEFNCVIVSTS